MNFDVAVCVYEDSVETVKRCIESVKDHVRHIFVVDGKFEFFESENMLSSKQVREYLKSVPNVILRDAPNLKENEKRQIYLDMCEKYYTEFLLPIDADEYITDDTDWDAVHAELVEKYAPTPKLWGVMLGKGYFPRIWMNPHLIEFTETHNFWRFKTDGSIYKSTIGWQPIHNITIKGDDKLRTEEYTTKSYQYQKKLMAYEKPYKEEYRKIARNTKETAELYTFHGIPMV